LKCARPRRLLPGPNTDEDGSGGTANISGAMYAGVEKTGGRRASGKVPTLATAAEVTLRRLRALLLSAQLLRLLLFPPL
jgi:hypothetical protein